MQVKGRGTGFKMAQHEPISGHEPQPPSARSTGFVFAAVSLVAAWVARHTGWTWLFVGLSGVFAALAAGAPSLLEPLNRAWFRLSLLLGKVVTPIVMAILFYGFITPYGLILRLTGADPLRLRRKGDETTWWRERQEKSAPMNKQF